MSEPTWTTMHIGGTLPASKIDALLEVIEMDFFELADGPENEDRVRYAAEVNESLCMQGQVNFGNPEAVVNFCQEHGLTYWLHNDGGREWDPGIQVWKTGWEHVEECAASGQRYEPVIELSGLRRRALTKDLGKIIEDLALFESSNVPALTITEDAEPADGSTGS